MPVEIIDQKKKNVVEVLLIIKRVRAKGEDDEGLARIYEPGEEIRIKGSGKLSLLALGKATRNLEYNLEGQKNSGSKRSESKGTKSEVKDAPEKEKVIPPNLNAMKIAELDEYAEVSLNINTKSFKTKPEKIAAIKSALRHGNN